jgi:hypothetical protein
MSEHRLTWDEESVGSPGVTTPLNVTAASIAIERSDEIAWQWGFWPFTTITSSVIREGLKHGSGMVFDML